MNTMENNKLIVEFMELIPTKVSTDFYALVKNHVHITGKNQNIVISGFSECAKYHSDWNWLMEVVEKIESLGNDVLITSNYIQIAYNEGENFIVIELEGNIKIFAVYNACVEFIKWYNQQKK